MGHEFDHKTPGDNLLIYNMTRNRLPFIADVPANKTMLSNFTWEVMNQLEVCLRITDKDEPDNVVGEEANYTALQQSLIADLVSIAALVLAAAGGWDFSTGTAGSGSSSSSAGTFLKKVKGGSAELEYDQFDGTKAQANSTMGSVSLLGYYKKQAINKGAQLGCLIDICDDCSVTVGLMNEPLVKPFIVITGCST